MSSWDLEWERRYKRATQTEWLVDLFKTDAVKKYLEEKQKRVDGARREYGELHEDGCLDMESIDCLEDIDILMDKLEDCVYKMHSIAEKIREKVAKLDEWGVFDNYDEKDFESETKDLFDGVMDYFNSFKSYIDDNEYYLSYSSKTLREAFYGPKEVTCTKEDFYRIARSNELILEDRGWHEICDMVESNN